MVVCYWISCNFVHSEFEIVSRQKNNVFAVIFKYLVLCLSVQSFKESNRI